jgi:hypothetical protein
MAAARIFADGTLATSCADAAQRSAARQFGGVRACWSSAVIRPAWPPFQGQTLWSRHHLVTAAAHGQEEVVALGVNGLTDLGELPDAGDDQPAGGTGRTTNSTRSPVCRFAIRRRPAA